MDWVTLRQRHTEVLYWWYAVIAVWCLDMRVRWECSHMEPDVCLYLALCFL